MTEQGSKDLIQKGKDLRLIIYAARRLGWIGVTKENVLKERDEFTRDGRYLTVSEVIWRIADRYVADPRATGRPVPSMSFADMAHVAGYEGKSTQWHCMDYRASLDGELDKQFKEECERPGVERDSYRKQA